MKKYFYSDGLDKYGPFLKEELKGENLSSKTKVWCLGMDNWVELINVPQLSDVLDSLTQDEIPQDSEDQQITESIQPIYRKNDLNKVEKNKFDFFNVRYALIVLVLAIAFFSYSAIKRHSNAKMYNEIVLNSFDGDFDIYIEKFYRDLEAYGVFPQKPRVTIVKFSNLDQIENTTHIHGLSFGRNDDEKIEIYINHSSWIKFNRAKKYYIMYHELAHDVLNLKDLKPTHSNEEKMMYPAISTFENLDMDDFIESAHALFEDQM